MGTKEQYQAAYKAARIASTAEHVRRLFFRYQDSFVEQDTDKEAKMAAVLIRYYLPSLLADVTELKDVMDANKDDSGRMWDKAMGWAKGDVNLAVMWLEGYYGKVGG